MMQKKYVIKMSVLLISFLFMIAGCGEAEEREVEEEVELYSYERLEIFIESLTVREVDEEEANAVLEAYFKDEEESIYEFEDMEMETSRGAAVPSPKKKFSHLQLIAAYIDEDGTLYAEIDEVYDNLEKEGQRRYDYLVKYTYEDEIVTILKSESLD
jgi:hypothetical protein